MSTVEVQVTILDYPGSMQTAVYGLNEMFQLADSICREQQVQVEFLTRIVSLQELVSNKTESKCRIIIVPPSITGASEQPSDASVLAWLVSQHKAGAILCSVCAGTFILAETGLLTERRVTTHWSLAKKLAATYKDLIVQEERIIINDGDIITAGGLMAWLDLGLELVTQFASLTVMKQLGRYMVVDTAPREQRYYQSFVPKLDHGDQSILSIQHAIQAKYQEPLGVGQLAKNACMTERTFLRHFRQATGFNPVGYIQRLRVQKACDLLESTKQSFESISVTVGYEDAGSFRKLFIKILGLTPREFRQRFGC